MEGSSMKPDSVLPLALAGLAVLGGGYALYVYMKPAGAASSGGPIVNGYDVKALVDQANAANVPVGKVVSAAIGHPEYEAHIDPATGKKVMTLKLGGG